MNIKTVLSNENQSKLIESLTVLCNELYEHNRNDIIDSIIDIINDSELLSNQFVFESIYDYNSNVNQFIV